MKLEDHPTVQRIRLKTVPSVPSAKQSLDAGWLKQLVLDAGADDVVFVGFGRPALDDQRQDILMAIPHARTLISFVASPDLIKQKALRRRRRRACSLRGREWLTPTSRIAGGDLDSPCHP